MRTVRKTIVSPVTLAALPRGVIQRTEPIQTRVGVVDLRAYPRPDGSPQTPREILQTPFFAQTEARKESRKRFGRSLSMDRIETALLAAFGGSMRDITDVLAETVDTDPHLGSVLNKRFGALSALPWEVQPASGVGIDRDKALFYAEVVRAQLKSMKSFRKNLNQLAWGLWNGRACLEMNWIQVMPGQGQTSDRFGTVSMAVAEMDWIHPRRLTFGPRRELRIQAEREISTGTFADSGIDVRAIPDKFVWWLPQLFNEYPEREGLGIRCMYWSFFKRFAARERMILTELYGKPWRILEVDKDSPAGKPELEDADRIVDALGAAHTARMPRGVKLNVEAPQKSAGEVHQDIIAEADRQNSKLVLGQTGTTDGVPSGLNNNQANVMQDEQLGVLFRDSAMLSEVIETFLCDCIISVNFGPLEVTHAPVFRLRADLPADRTAEIGRLKSSLDAGLAIDLAEAYEVSGFQRPDENAIVLRIEQPPTAPNSPVAPAVRPVVVYPKGLSPEAGEQQPITPEAGVGAGEEKSGAQVGVVDSASTIKVNEDRASRGLSPLTLPDGSPDPRGELTVKEFNELTAAAAAAARAPAPVAPTPATLEPPPADPLAIAASRRRLEYVGERPEEGNSPHGDGGMHGHALSREALRTALDAPHAHVFRLPGGQFVLSELDGAHSHAIAAVSEDMTILDGEHTHAVMVDGTMLLAGSDGAHRHALQVDVTAVDGAHTHALAVPDPANPGQMVTVRSMTAGEIFAEIAAGTFPEELLDEDDEEGNPAGDLVIAPPERLELQRFQTVLASMRDAAASYELVHGAERGRLELQRWQEWVRANEIHLATRQPTTSDGSPDDVVDRGMRELVQTVNSWADAFERAATGKSTSLELFKALAQARKDLPVAKFGRALERRQLQAFMLGAIDNAKELAGWDQQTPAVGRGAAQRAAATFARCPDVLATGISRASWIMLAGAGEFAKKPFKQALKHFQTLKLLDRLAYEKASAAIKQRSFTVAGVVGDQMLQLIHGELVKSIEAGDDLRRFKERIQPRLQEAGFVAGTLKTGAEALSPSHVETVFRTNVLNTYNTGRYAHQSSPAVQAAFPVWQIQGINDTRTRHTHLGAQGKKLLATDPFWGTAYPPFGFNCRCRVKALPRSELKNVVPGSSIQGLPDQGFTSGRPALATG